MLQRTLIRYFLIFNCSLFILLTGCKKQDDGITPSPDILTVVTHPYTDLTRYSVKVGGTITNKGQSKIKEAGFVFDTIAAPTIERNVNKSIQVVKASGEMLLTLTGMPGEKMIYVRAYASNENRFTYGNEIKFKSLPEKVFPGKVSLSTQQQVIEFGRNQYTSVGELTITGTVTDLSPLKNLASIGYGLYLRNTTMLTSLKGLDSLEAANAIPLYHGIYIENNSALKSLKGLDRMVSTNGDLSIKNNDELTDLNGLNSLIYIHLGDLLIEGCEKLQSLNGLEKFIWLYGDLVLKDNPQLTDLSGLKPLSVLMDRIKIYNNSSLQNLEGLESLHKIEGLEVYDNPLLSDLKGLNNLDSITGPIVLKNNRILHDLSAFSKISQTEYLSIMGSPSLTSLAGLENLKSVRHAIYIYSTGLTTLLGLKNLESARVIDIYDNAGLKNLQGLNNLHSLIGESYSLLIHNNNQLSSLSGLEKLMHADAREGSIQIIDNVQLKDFCGLKPMLASNWFGFFYLKGNLTNPVRTEIVNNCKL